MGLNTGCHTVIERKGREVTPPGEEFVSEGAIQKGKVHINDAGCIYELGHKTQSFSECLSGPKATLQ